MRPLSEESGEPNEQRFPPQRARGATPPRARASPRDNVACHAAVSVCFFRSTIYPASPLAGTIIETPPPPPMAQRGTSASRPRRGPIPALLVAMGLVAPNRAAAFTTTSPPSPARHRRTQSSVLLGAEPTDRRGALIGGLLGGYTLFELSGGAKRLQDATGIGIGALKNSTMTE